MIHSWFHRRRMHLHKSQREVANAVGVTDDTVGRWERFLNLPDIRKMVELANAYEVGVDEIVTEIVAAAKHIIACRLKGVDPRSVPQANGNGPEGERHASNIEVGGDSAAHPHRKQHKPDPKPCARGRKATSPCAMKR